MSKGMKAGPKRKAYVPAGKMDGKVLTHMREVAFGNAAYFETKAVIENAERLRDDDGLLKAAEDKRKRKLEMNKAHK